MRVAPLPSDIPVVPSQQLGQICDGFVVVVFVFGFATKRKVNLQEGSNGPQIS